MDAWPIEEVWLRPAVTPLLSALVPFGTAWVLRAVLSGDARQIDRAGAFVGLAQVEIAWWLGVTTLGPRLVDTPAGWASHAFAAACAMLAAATTERALRRPFEPRALGIVAVATVAAAIAAALVEAPRGWVGALALVPAWWMAERAWRRTSVRARQSVGTVTAASSEPGEIEGSRASQAPFPGPPTEPEGSGGVAIAAALVVSALLIAGAALAWTLTDVDEGEAPTAGAAAATWRLRVDPWDPAAMLAAAWASRGRDELDRAVVQAREARRMGLPEAPALELEAEVLAARGRCADARAVFDRALRARAERMFDDDPLAAPLSLGGYHLPPTLVAECDGLDSLPRLDLDLGE